MQYEVICPRCGFLIEAYLAKPVCRKCKLNIYPLKVQKGRKIHEEIVPGGLIRIDAINNILSDTQEMYRVNLVSTNNGNKKVTLLRPISFFSSVETAKLAIDDYKKFPYFVGEDPTIQELFDTALLAIRQKESFYANLVPIFTDEDRFIKYDFYEFPYRKFEPHKKKGWSEKLWDIYMVNIRGKRLSDVWIGDLKAEFDKMDLYPSVKGTLKRSLRVAFSFAEFWELDVSNELMDYVDESIEMGKLTVKTDKTEELLKFFESKDCPIGFAIMYVNRAIEIGKVDEILKSIAEGTMSDVDEIDDFIESYRLPADVI